MSGLTSLVLNVVAGAYARGQETTGNQERRRSGMADGERIHTFFLSPPTHRTRGWFLSTHSRVACSSVGRNNVMLCYVMLLPRARPLLGVGTVNQETTA